MAKTGENLFMLSALPAPEVLGQTPPMTLAELLEHVAPCPGPRSLVEAVLLSDDLLQRQAVMAGEVDQPTPAVLSDEQLRDEAPLPDYLAEQASPDSQRPAGEDMLWETYFRYVAGVAGQARSSFLKSWVAFEVGLRNAIATSRARALQLEAGSYLVAEELGSEPEYFTATVNEWSAATTPLDGMRSLDETRWRWLDENDAWFSFSDDELAAYAVRLMLLTRWHRLAEQQHSDSAEPNTPTQA